MLSLGADYENPDTNGSYTLNWVRPAGASGPDVVQQSTVCGPLMSDDAEGGLTQWTAASSDLIAPMWQTSSLKPQHSSTAFWANPVSEQETQNTSATLTFNNPIAIPSSGITTLNFSEWYFNESDDHGTSKYPKMDPGLPSMTTTKRFHGDERLRSQMKIWKAKQLDLTIYSGRSIQLRFPSRSAIKLLRIRIWLVRRMHLHNQRQLYQCRNYQGTSHPFQALPTAHAVPRPFNLHVWFATGSWPYSNQVSATVSDNLCSNNGEHLHPMREPRSQWLRHSDHAVPTILMARSVR